VYVSTKICEELFFFVDLDPGMGVRRSRLGAPLPVAKSNDFREIVCGL
jgi:hypothetical protein